MNERAHPPAGERPPGRSRLARRLVGGALSLVFASLCTGLVGSATGAWLYRRHVVDAPGPHLDKQHIRSIIAQESPVYYSDGLTRVGVFFEAEHRHYVGWDQLPEAYVVALVAAEDDRFWTHHGVNLRGLVRALRDNALAGEVVAGGSTLTQQTAKNLYYRPDRTLRSKLVELLNALRLEAHYDKKEILTFYANQFHVTGNGRGLGIAARHFFDKEVDELTMLECAFLAGLVKAPAHYDPFLGDAQRRESAIRRAHERTRYVLARMVEEPTEGIGGFARTPAELARVAEIQRDAARLLEEGLELEFRRGTFRYDSSAVLDEVARRLAEPPFDELLAAAGISDPATAGLKVITTLDAGIQHAATGALWHHLTEVGTWMEKLRPEDFVLHGDRGPALDPDFPPIQGEFRLARVTEVLDPDGKPHLGLDLGGHPGVVDRDGIVRVALAVWRGEKGDRNAKVPTEAVDAVIAAMPPGSVVRVSVREVTTAGPARCDLEVRPELQGSVVVLQDGQIRAMVGGNDNRNFNRATAVRQMGSTWKPLVYHAALQLGWDPEDLLDNRRNVFPFSTTFYLPHPDHTPVPEVTMSWAGVNSENLASVWLLYHLTDRLDGERVRQLAHSLGLTRRADESEDDYRLRIQTAGVLPTRSRVAEGLFLQARQEVADQLDLGDEFTSGRAGGREPGSGLAASREFGRSERLALQSLLYGWGFDRERERSRGQAHLQRALDNSWLHLEPLIDRCERQYAVLEEAWRDGRAPPAEAVADLRVRVEEERVRVACGTAPEGFVAPDRQLVEEVSGTFGEAPPPWPGGAPNVPFGDPGRTRSAFGPPRRGPDLDPVEATLIDDRLHLGTLRAVQDVLARRRLAVELSESAPDLYAPEILFHQQDFRVLLALRYVASLAEQYGVQTEIALVPSLPLGASEVTLEEMTSVYQGLTSGRAWAFPGMSAGRRVAGPPTPGLLIAEIRDVDDRILYRATPEPSVVVAPEIAALTNDILRNVVRWGTGRRADQAVWLEGAGVPLSGKTGTTNDFKNAAFLGVVPRWEDGAFRSDRGYVVGVYVGYDDNRPMEQGGIKLAGATAALPTWIRTAAALADQGLLGDPDAAPSGDRWALTALPGLNRVAVDPERGGVPLDALEPAPEVASMLVRARHPAPPPLEFEFLDRPARVAPRTEDALDDPWDRAPEPRDVGPGPR